MANGKITVPVLVGETEEVHNLIVSPEEYAKIIDGDQELLRQLIFNKKGKKNTALQGFANVNDVDAESTDSIPQWDHNDNEGIDTCSEEETFSWPEKAVMLFLELYREKENEFTSGLKRHNKLWSEIAFELQKSNYNVSGVQVQNKMSGLKRTYKKIKDSNTKSGNYNSCWSYYSVMDSLFGAKSWVVPVATASSDGPTATSSILSSESTCHSSSSSLSVDDFQYNDTILPKPKKRRMETILESFISDVKSNINQKNEEKRKERLRKEEKKEQRWEEKKQMHKETTEIQKSLVDFLGKLVEKQKEPK